MLRQIVHLDLDAFFCAVEEQRQPSLRGQRFAVGGRPEARGVVASCSYAARRFGVRSAMPMARAVRLCPGLVIVPARHKLYAEVSRQVMDRTRAVTPHVEQISIDEAFLDVSDLPDPGESIARELQRTITRELGLPCSLGIAANKLVAKIATEVGKAAARSDRPPNAIQVVPPGTEADFLAPLPADMLWGVGPKTGARLAAMGAHTIGDIARQSDFSLGHAFGKVGYELALRARGIDTRPVVTTHEAKSISQETTFAVDVRDKSRLLATLRALCARVGSRLRRHGLSGLTVKLKIRWPDFTTPTRQMTLPQPTDQDEAIYAAAEQLFSKVWPARQPVRLLGVGVSGLRPRPRQLSLWDQPADRDRRLSAAVAALRDKFGDRIVRRASELSPED